MANRQHFTKERIAEALRVSAGVYALAADKLGCAPNTIKNYVRRYKYLQKVEEEIREQTLDLAESALLKMIGDQNHRNHATAVIFYLKTKGKARGYVERSEVTGPQGAPVAVIGAYLPREGPE